MRAFMFVLMALAGLALVALGLAMRIDPTMTVAGMPLLTPNTEFANDAYMVAIQANIEMVCGACLVVMSFVQSAFE